MLTVHLLIKGKVQGIFYRASARKVAGEHKLTGWIKNTEEGFVEAVATGSDEQINTFVDWCRKGPTLAQVSEVIVSDIRHQHFSDFLIVD